MVGASVVNGAVVVGAAVVVVVVGAVVVVVGATVVVVVVVGPTVVVVGATVVVVGATVVVVGAIVVVVGVLVVIEYTRTCPASTPVSLLMSAPTATLVPSDDNDTDRPERSPSASPSMSAPFCCHAFSFHT